jgi:NDP-sugar pyrophosphorylase family protein
MCGGLGTRFKSVSTNTPKILAPIGKKKLLDLILENLYREKVKRIILATGYLSEKISQYIADMGYKDILISKEKNPSGTGGALRLSYDKFETDEILVMNGDTYVSFDLKEVLNYHRTKKSCCTIITSEKENNKDYGSIDVEKDGLITKFCEKSKNCTSNYVSTGVYIINRNLINKINHKSIEYNFFPLLCKEKKLYSYKSENDFYDIGTKERYLLFKNKVENDYCTK